MIATEPAPSRNRHRVLCVDDNELSAFVNATILRNEGYEVWTCSDPLQATSIAKSEELDLAILDYEMPKMNGAELAAFCKAANPDIKVILFSGSLNIPTCQLALADQFVEKSAGIEVLLMAIDALLTNSNTRLKWVSRIESKHQNTE